MSPQYKLLTELLGLLKEKGPAGVMQLQVESLIYRLKLLLLVCEGEGAAERNRLCPLAMLKFMRQELAASATPHQAASALLQLHTDLGQMIRQIEEAYPEAARTPAGISPAGSQTEGLPAGRSNGTA